MEFTKEGKRYRIVSVRKEDCTSCSTCVSHLPQYFRMDDQDLSESHNDGENINFAHVPEEDWDDVQEIIDICPGECIYWNTRDKES